MSFLGEHLYQSTLHEPLTTDRKPSIQVVVEKDIIPVFRPVNSFDPNHVLVEDELCFEEPIIDTRPLLAMKGDPKSPPLHVAHLDNRFVGGLRLLKGRKGLYFYKIAGWPVAGWFYPICSRDLPFLKIEKPGDEQAALKIKVIRPLEPTFVRGRDIPWDRVSQQPGLSEPALTARDIEPPASDESAVLLRIADRSVTNGGLILLAGQRQLRHNPYGVNSWLYSCPAADFPFLRIFSTIEPFSPPAEEPKVEAPPVSKLPLKRELAKIRAALALGDRKVI